MLKVLQGVVNRALLLDPQVSTVLEPLAGKRIAVHITGAMPLKLLVEISHERIFITQDDEQTDEALQPGVHRDPGVRRCEDADVRITGSLTALTALLQGADELPSTAQVRVYGDVALLQQARVAAARLRPDFEEPIARLLGDELAYPLSRVVRRVAASARRTIHELAEDAREFLGEESELLAAQDSMSEFGDEVDRLRDALARLEKRVSRVAGVLDSAQ
ncbi:MAG: ubiquinone biosynthesis protein UbiJ [Gammaproteobacteria bacterium]|jgi:ubiquinone biosynthesis protein UbiJ